MGQMVTTIDELEERLFRHRLFSAGGMLLVVMSFAFVYLSDWVNTLGTVGPGSIQAAVVYVGWADGEAMTCYRKYNGAWHELECPAALTAPNEANK